MSQANVVAGGGGGGAGGLDVNTLELLVQRIRGLFNMRYLIHLHFKQ